MPPLKTSASYVPTGDQPAAIAALSDGLRAGRALPDAARRDRHRQDRDDGVDHRADPAAGARDRAQQDARRAALQRVPRVLPRQRGRVLRLVLRLLPARGVRARRPTSTSRRTRSRNDDIDRLRHAATSSLLSRRDMIIVASVSCIYGLGSPEEYEKRVVFLTVGEETDRDLVLRKLIDIQYVRNDTLLGRGRFRVKGDVIEIQPAHSETAYRISFFGDEVEQITHFDPLTGEVLSKLEHITVFPATQYVTSKPTIERAAVEIRHELEEQVKLLRVEGDDARGAPDPAAHRVRPRDDAGARLLQRDRELLAHPRRPPAGLGAAHAARLLPVRLRRLRRRVAPDGAADRRHVRGRPLAQADARRLRLPAAVARSTTGRCASTSSSSKVPQMVFVSATPGAWELRHSTRVAEQLIRPTVPRRPRGRAAADEEPDRRPAERDPPARGASASACSSRR